MRVENVNVLRFVSPALKSVRKRTDLPVTEQPSDLRNREAAIR